MCMPIQTLSLWQPLKLKAGVRARLESKQCTDAKPLTQSALQSEWEWGRIVLWLIRPSVVTFHQLITLLVGSIIGWSNLQRRQIWYKISPTCKPCSSVKATPLTFRNEAIQQHQHIIMRSCASWQLTSANIWWSRLAGFKLPCKRSKH